MRDRVKVRLGGKDYSLLPTMGVLDAFEDRFGSIGAHVQRLAGEAALFQHRAFLIWQALQADPSNRQEFEGRVIEFGLDATKAAMFDAGLYSEALVMAEVELIERLIYTPEQYTEKKAQREAEAASLRAASQLFSASTPST